MKDSRYELKEPTGEECSNNTIFYEDEYYVVYADWYPQMGGYVGKAIIEATRQSPKARNKCFDAWVWHDGDFPFGDDSNPICIHHCCAEQFIDFGNTVLKMQKDEE